MKNVMEINGVNAVIAFDPEINMFRGEFVGLNGGGPGIPPIRRMLRPWHST